MFCAFSVHAIDHNPDWHNVLQAWPELQLRLVGGAGHSHYDPAIQHELLDATDAMRDHLGAAAAIAAAPGCSVLIESECSSVSMS